VIGEQIIRDLKERRSPWRAVVLAKAASPAHEIEGGFETALLDFDWQPKRLPYNSAWV